MIISANLWLKAAAIITGGVRGEWLAAMKGELAQFDDEKSRREFAAGCFMAALTDYARSRRGLSYMARGGGSAFVLLASGYGFGTALRWMGAAETAAPGKLIAALCLYYAMCAGMLWASLRGLRIFAIAGFLAALTGHIYVSLAAPKFETMSPEFLRAISFEMAGLMTGFFIAAIFLGLLYDPNDQSC